MKAVRHNLIVAKHDTEQQIKEQQSRLKWCSYDTEERKEKEEQVNFLKEMVTELQVLIDRSRKYN